MSSQLHSPLHESAAVYASLRKFAAAHLGPQALFNARLAISISSALWIRLASGPLRQF